MSQHGHRAISHVIRSVLVIITIGLISAILAGASIARPIQRTLPKPYILNRGDGDTINGKYFTYDTNGSGDVLLPSSPLSTELDNPDLRVNEQTRRPFRMKWMILYRLIK